MRVASDTTQVPWYGVQTSKIRPIAFDIVKDVDVTGCGATVPFLYEYVPAPGAYHGSCEDRRILPSIPHTCDRAPTQPERPWQCTALTSAVPPSSPALRRWPTAAYACRLHTADHAWNAEYMGRGGAKSTACQVASVCCGCRAGLACWWPSSIRHLHSIIARSLRHRSDHWSSQPSSNRSDA